MIIIILTTIIISSVIIVISRGNEYFHMIIKTFTVFLKLYHELKHKETIWYGIMIEDAISVHLVNLVFWMHVLTQCSTICFPNNIYDMACAAY